MEFPNISALKEDAALALRRGREPKDLILWYSLLSTLIAAALTLTNFWLGHQISNTGGLSGMGTRTLLSTFRTVLPLAQTVILSCLQLGYQQGILRICRRQYADRTDLKSGFHKAFPLIRLMILQSIVSGLAVLLSYQIASTIYLLTPWADTMMALLAPLTQDMNIIDPSLVLTEEFLLQAAPAAMPLMVIWLIAMLVLLIPLGYRMRFANYALLDEPGSRAFLALRASVKMTRRNCRKLFRLDLSFWWYYGLSLLAALVGYLDAFLPLLGITLPLNATVSYFLFYGVYLAATFAISYCFQNRIQSTYAMAYESLRDKPANDGVVLGNIFDV